MEAGEYGVGVPGVRGEACLRVALRVIVACYIMKDLPHAEATASMISARLLLMTCLAMSLDDERIVVVRNCNKRGRTGSTTSGLTTPATKPTLSHTASLESIALIDGSHVRTLTRVTREHYAALHTRCKAYHGVEDDAQLAAATYAATSSPVHEVNGMCTLQWAAARVTPARRSTFAEASSQRGDDRTGAITLCNRKTGQNLGENDGNMRVELRSTQCSARRCCEKEGGRGERRIRNTRENAGNGVVAVHRARKREGFDEKRLSVLGRIFEQQRCKEAGCLKDGGVRWTAAVPKSFFVDFGKDSDKSFEAETHVHGVQFRPLLRGADEPRRWL